MKGKPTAAVIAPEVGEEVEKQRDARWGRFWQTVDRIRERNADKDPDEILRDVTAVVEEVRQEHHERARREASGRR
jgi:hypothetical protein